MSIAAIALHGSIGNGLSVALFELREREAALLTFMVSASGISFFGIGSAFWGLVAGLLTLLIVNAGKD